MKKIRGKKKFGKPREKKFLSFDLPKGVFTEGKKTYSSFPKKKFEFYLAKHKNILLKEIEDDFYYFVNRKFSNYIDRFKVISQEEFTNFAEAKAVVSQAASRRDFVLFLSGSGKYDDPDSFKKQTTFRTNCGLLPHAEEKRERKK